MDPNTKPDHDDKPGKMGPAEQYTGKDENYEVDASPEFTAGTSNGDMQFPVCQSCGFNTQCRCDKGDTQDNEPAGMTGTKM